MSRLRLAALLGFLSTGFFAVQVAAFDQPAHQPTSSAPVLSSKNPERQRALNRSPGWQSFRAQYGPWVANWNERTRTPHRAFGRGIPLTGFGDDPAAVDRAVRTFIAGHPQVFGSLPTLETVHVQKVDRVWTARYRRTVGGIPVLFEDWEFRVGTNGKLFAFGVDAHSLDQGVVQRPRIDGSAARVAAQAGFAFNPATDRVEGGSQLYVLPGQGEDGRDGRVVYDVRVITADPPGNWITLVDAATGDVLWRHDRVRYNIGGTVTGAVHLLLPTDPTSVQPFGQQFVTVGANTGSTLDDGTYSLPGGASLGVTAQIRGDFCDVNRSDGTPDASFATTASDGATVDISWAAANDGERDGFYHTNIAHDYSQTMDPALTFTGNDYIMTCTVNIAGSCNAFWDGSGINFYRVGGGCPNMATMPDVVYHEYGHGVNDNLYGDHGAPFGMLNGALHEGLADVNAAFIQDDPNVGKGFFGPGTVLRSIDNLARWPENASGDGHITGLIIGGAFWDLRQSIGLATAELLVHRAKYGLPGNSASDDGEAMNDVFVEVLVRDDDNADLSDGTPNDVAIIDAFNAHGIGTGFYIDITHTPLGDQAGANPYPVTAVITYSGPIGSLDASTPRIVYSVNFGQDQTVPMTPTGNPDEFTGSIPGQSSAIIRYAIYAEDIYGEATSDPPGAAQGRSYAFLAGNSSTEFLHDHETGHGWTVGAPGDGAFTGIWIQADPVGTGAPAYVQPDDDHTANPGVQCFVTGNGTPGGALGEADVDGGRTTLTTPSFSALGSFQTPVISYYRWYTNNAGATPNSDLWRVDISNDDGANWTPVEATTVTEASWRRVLFFISDYVPPTATMKMRFIAADEGAGSLVEGAVDDFSLIGFSSTTAVEEGGEVGPLQLAQPWPNPSAGRVQFRYGLTRSGNASLVIYDVNGRLVRTLDHGVREAGEHTALWDGRDAAGNPAPSGTYFARLNANGDEVVRRFARMR